MPNWSLQVYQITSGDTSWVHSGNFTASGAGEITIADDNGIGDTIFGDATDGDSGDVTDQNVTSSTVGAIAVGDTVDSRYYVDVTGPDGFSARIYMIATNGSSNYGTYFVSTKPLDPSVTYTFGGWNRQGAVPYEQLVCFLPGTQIATLNGMVAVEDLKPGDMVLTMDNGPKPIRWIGSRKLDTLDLMANPKWQPVKIAKGALGENRPSKDLLVSRQHRFLVGSKVVERMFNTEEILVPAKSMLGLDGVEQMTEYSEVEYYHFMFDQHEIVNADGAWAESLYLGEQAQNHMPRSSLDEIASLFPNIFETIAMQSPARPIDFKGKHLRSLAHRHAKNEMVLQH